MIEISKVNFRYLGTSSNILNDVSLNIKKGEFIGIIGPTGSGKSTFCYLLNGLIPHSINGYFSGTVKINDIDTKHSSVDNLSSIVGYMLQEPSFQIATPYVESEIAFGMENLSIAPEEMQNRINEVLKILGIIHLRNKPTSDLSEGEKQRVILASILAMRPEILVLDECTSMLDVKSKNELANTLKFLHSDQDKTIVMIEHDLDFLIELADRIILMNSGKIVADGPKEDILLNVDLLAKNNLQAPNLVQIFKQLQERGLEIDQIPTSYKQGIRILEKLL